MTPPQIQSEFRLLAEFRRLFEGQVYRHRASNQGDFVAIHLYEDLVTINRSQRYTDAVLNRRDRVLNVQNRRRGVRARRGDATFGEIIPGEAPVIEPGYSVSRGPIATVEIGIEVKILAKAMIKQIDRVINDLCNQVTQFRRGGGNPICASAVTSKPANGGHPKTGQWKTRLGQHLLYPAQPRSGKEFQGKTFLWRAPEGREPRSGWWRGTPSSTLWECGNRAVGDFQARWETTENRRLVFRVFHGAAFP